MEAYLARGPVLFLKSGRLEGTSWESFSTANGMSKASLPDLLVELAATGSSTLYIDGIDRIEKQHQPIILDVVRAVMENPLLDNWLVLVSLRDTGIEPLRNWLGNVLTKTDDDAFQPQSEVDLIGNWWDRGGYDADGQKALDRQRAIVELSSQRARHFERDIAVRELSPLTLGVIDQFVVDGILQHVRVGHTPACGWT